MKIPKGYQPVYEVSIDLKAINTAQVNVVTQYVPGSYYAGLTMTGRIFNNLSNGQIQMGDETGIPSSIIGKEFGVPSTQVPSFLVRLTCEYDSGVLAQCINIIQQIADQTAMNGLSKTSKNDNVMLIKHSHHFGKSKRALDHEDLAVSAQVPVTVAKNAIVDLGDIYTIKDIYASVNSKTKKDFIKRAYLIPPKDCNFHVFSNGVGLFKKKSKKQLAEEADSTITWGQFVKKVKENSKNKKK